MEVLRWIKIVSFTSNDPLIRIDQSLSTVLSERAILHFGLKQTNCQIEFVDDPDYTDLNDKDSPISLFLSTKIFQDLLLPPGVQFQLRISEGELFLGPTIGLLFKNSKKGYTPAFMKKHYSTSMGIYPSIGGVIVAYSIEDIDWKKGFVKGMIYQPEKDTWYRGKTAIPAVTYRRHLNQPAFHDFRQKLYERNGQLFNSHRLSKWRTHDLLLKNPDFLKYLPETFVVKTSDQIQKVLQFYEKIIVKPILSAQGKGIVIVETIVNDDYAKKKYYVTFYPKSYGEPVRKIMNQKELDQYLSKLIHSNKMQFICQNYIPLAKVDELPFDVRVIMHKNLANEWECNGILCRIAREGKEITNYSAGGDVLSLEETLQRLKGQFDYPSIKNKILTVCREFCLWMEQQNRYHLVEFGIDLAIDQDGEVFFIEANFRPGCKGFIKTDFDQHLQIAYQPYCYAANLQKFHAPDLLGKSLEIHQ
jgi:glutathione synthase/RimK-type ligase-like ATP-grasp enzyme